MKKEICPHCLGTGEEYDPNLDNNIECTFCKNEKYVTEDKYMDYEPIKNTWLDENNT